MEALRALFSDPHIDLADVILRLLLSLLLGGAIGIEREYHRQPAGMRTHVLICVGACLLMILSIWLPQVLGQPLDPGRLAGQVVSGIGFLGAGAILRLGVSVRGLTTAASIWVVAGIGLAVGAGMYHGAFIGTGLILFTLAVLNYAERKLFPTTQMRALLIRLRSERLQLQEILSLIGSHGVQVRTVGVTQSTEEGWVELNLLVQVPMKLDFERLYSALRDVEGIEQIRIGQTI